MSKPSPLSPMFSEVARQLMSCRDCHKVPTGELVKQSIEVGLELHMIELLYPHFPQDIRDKFYDADDNPSLRN